MRWLLPADVRGDIVLARPRRGAATLGEPGAERRQWEGARLQNRPTNVPRRKIDAKAKLPCHYTPFESEQLKR